MNAIFKRRSIRKFKSDEVPLESIEEFIKAGMNAPSAWNQNLCHYIIINEQNKLDEISKMRHIIKGITVAILVCADINLEKSKGYWAIDCSASTENILIAIAENGFGSIWLSIYPRKDRMTGIKKILGLPKNILPFALLPVGYPAEDKPPNNKFEKSRIHYNKWN
jgi:nitroreductase